MLPLVLAALYTADRAGEDLGSGPSLGEGLQTSADRNAPHGPADGPPLVTAINQQLGLRLESTRGPVDVLVIDHAERPTPD